MFLVLPLYRNYHKIVMSDGTYIVLHSDLLSNKLCYAAEQAIACDQVLYCISICNSVLVEWHNIKSQDMNYADLFNNIIPEGSIRNKHTSKRIEEHVKVQCSHLVKQNKQLSLKG